MIALNPEEDYSSGVKFLQDFQIPTSIQTATIPMLRILAIYENHVMVFVGNGCLMSLSKSLEYWSIMAGHIKFIDVRADKF